ncbi:Nif3-like dinuclear metal center hexameric protein [Haloarcula nitratireducens]|uniref:Nif3-like dinuclear metal center hexameric protein n=1 Tax=Haloarcula nitratireducens TaxID=2487749 RepID=A0AAW4PBW3_9EURY|nr:Nif3-like dinuclear metal center hexameric protein [Halomicroarcula nitratireducens]MBX0294762.1 Nif3-like dinuclear metal center hexameric protein [Halomicroarcula nitratireducens]
MHAGELAARLDEELAVDAYADIDASPNGLQVGPADRDVDRVALAVDAAAETIDRAGDAGADLLLAHHGIVWGSVERVTGTTYDRVAPLVEDGLALYVAHLPLDGHQTLGNAAGVADLLDLDDRQPFGSIGGEHIGQRGTLSEPTPLSDLTGTLESSLDTGGQPVQTLDFGPESVEDVAVVTGSGADWVGEADESHADVFVTGEGKQQVYHEAREAGINVVLAGHYATETFGVRSVGSLLEEWGLETTFIDCPTGL